MNELRARQQIETNVPQNIFFIIVISKLILILIKLSHFFVRLSNVKKQTFFESNQAILSWDKIDFQKLGK